LDGTLYDSPEYSKHLEEAITSIVSEELSMEQAEASALLKRKRKEIGTLTRSIESLGIDRNRFYQMISNRIQPSLYIQPNPTVSETIKKLKLNGFRVGLVSNSGRELVVKILDAIQVATELFDTIVTSTEAEPKPSPQPYLLAVENLGCRKDEAVYVGDREISELRPARELGLKTVLVSPEKEKSDWADLVVSHIVRLPEVLVRE
jgi:HAD superfamily hydrolase (TIGR01509 family)